MADFAPTDPSQNTPHIQLNSGDDRSFTEADDAHNLDVPNQTIGRALTPGMTIPIPPSPASTFQSTIASPNPQESSELLIPPRPHRFRDDLDPRLRSPDMSIMSSRRTSWSSEFGTHDLRGYGYSPVDDSRTPSQAESEENDVNTQTVSEKYNIMPTEGLLLFPEDIEKDDHLHNPDAADTNRKCDLFNRRGLMNIGGLTLLTLGILTLFIGYPVMYVLSCGICAWSGH